MAFSVDMRSSDRARLTSTALNFLDGISQKLGSALAYPGQNLDARTACLQFVGFRDTLDRLLAGSAGHRSFGLHRDLSGTHWPATWINEYKVRMASTILFPEVALPIYHLYGIPISWRRLATSPDYIEESRHQQMDLLIARVALQ